MRVSEASRVVIGTVASNAPIEECVWNLSTVDVAPHRDSFRKIFFAAALVCVKHGVVFRDSDDVLTTNTIDNFIRALEAERTYQDSLTPEFLHGGRPSKFEEAILIKKYLIHELSDAYGVSGSWTPTLHVARKVAAIALRAMGDELVEAEDLVDE